MLGEFEKLKAPNMTSKVIDGTIPPETQFDGQKFDVIFVRLLHTCLNGFGSLIPMSRSAARPTTTSTPRRT